MTETLKQYLGAGTVKPACERCAHVGHETDAQGNPAGYSCRAQPPQVMMAEQELPPAFAMQLGRKTALMPLSVFPPVSGQSWCGKFADSKSVQEFNG